MKKFFSVFMIAVCCMVLAMPAQAQLIKFGVKGGVNLSKLKLEGMKDNSTGFFFGPMAEITIPVIGLGVDGALLYSQKGDKMEGLDMKQSGLDIPVNLKYSIGLGSMLGIYVAVVGSRSLDKKRTGYFAARLRSFSSSRILRRRIECGVTSTYSSPWMYSSASSSVKTFGGAIDVLSSDPEARMFVSCLALVTLTVMSFWRVCSPITCPS